MRALHPAEARVTQAMLAGGDPREAAGRLPRRTRQTVLRRLDGWGWFVERLVPTRACVDAPVLTFAIARPYVERAPAFEARWVNARETVLSWSGDGVMLGVLASPSIAAAEAVARRVLPTADARRELFLRADLRAGGIVSYFDFEGAWVRFSGLEGVRAYPQGVADPVRTADDPDSAPDPPDRVRRGIRSVVEMADVGGSDRGKASFVPAPPEGPDVERLLRGGWMVRRRFLDPIAVGRTLTTFPANVVLIWGRPAEPGGLGGLFPDLVSIARVAPFLLVISPEGAVAGFLARPTIAAPPDRGGVLPVLRRYLTQIQSIRWPIGSMRTVVQHRFSPLLRGSEAPPGIPVDAATRPADGPTRVLPRRDPEAGGVE